jgi:hypothetical protein
MFISSEPCNISFQRFSRFSLSNASGLAFPRRVTNMIIGKG